MCSNITNLNLFIFILTISRVSVVEPGYVKTKMVQQFGPTSSDCWAYVASNIPDEDDRKHVTDMVTFDPEIVIGSEMQEPEVVAKVIQDVILSPKPDFRYQTSETIKRLSRETFVDPTSNSIINAWLKE